MKVQKISLQEPFHSSKSQWTEAKEFHQVARPLFETLDP